MHDTPTTLLLPTSSDFGPATPSGLTPGTRSEAEAALTHNSLVQTESAAPTTPLATQSSNTLGREVDGVDEAQQSYWKPRGPIRTSSTNYMDALQARKQSSVSSDLSTSTPEGTAEPGGNTEATVTSPTGTVPFPVVPGQGVVPLHTGVGSGQAEAVKKARPHGLSLGGLARAPSWSGQDMKHVYSATLMAEPKKEDPGYGSSTEAKGAKAE